MLLLDVPLTFCLADIRSRFQRSSKRSCTASNSSVLRTSELLLAFAQELSSLSQSHRTGLCCLFVCKIWNWTKPHLSILNCPTLELFCCSLVNVPVQLLHILLRHEIQHTLMRFNLRFTVRFFKITRIPDWLPSLWIGPFTFGNSSLPSICGLRLSTYTLLLNEIVCWFDRRSAITAELRRLLTSPHLREKGAYLLYPFQRSITHLINHFHHFWWKR